MTRRIGDRVLVELKELTIVDQDHLGPHVRYFKGKGLVVTVEEVYMDGRMLLGIWKKR